MESNEVTHIEAMKKKLKTAASLHTSSYFQPTTECGEALKVEVSKSGAPTSRFMVDQNTYTAIAAQDINKDTQLSNDDQVGISKNRLSSTSKRSSTSPKNSSEIFNGIEGDNSKKSDSSAHKQNACPPKIYVNGNNKYINHHGSTRKRRSMLPVKIESSKNAAFIPTSNSSSGKARRKSDYSVKDDFNRRQKSYGAGSTLRIADDAQELLMGTKIKYVSPH